MDQLNSPLHQGVAAQPSNLSAGSTGHQGRQQNPFQDNSLS
jgi:hypothetical protein